MIVVGSTALKHFGLNRLEPKDLDIWLAIGTIGNSKDDLFYLEPEILALIPTEEGYATPNAVYTIKCSHFAYDIKWEKNKKDILWLKSKGCVLIPKLYEELKKVWKKEHGNKEFLSLTKKSADFFDDHVKYKYDHDYLHSLVAHPNNPIYTECLSENQSVFIDKGKFFSLPKEKQLRMFKEEITVIAMERWVINGTADWFKAYSMSLKKTITNLTKNWACDFIIENLDFYTKPDFSYFKYILNKLNLKSKNMQNEKIFIQLLEELKTSSSLKTIVYNLSEGDNYFENEDNVPWDSYREHTKKVLETWEYKHIYSKGGGEGGAEDCEGVFSLKGVYYKTNYSYYSHQGYDYDDILNTLKVVTPEEEIRTVYT